MSFLDANVKKQNQWLLLINTKRPVNSGQWDKTTYPEAKKRKANDKAVSFYKRSFVCTTEISRLVCIFHALGKGMLCVNIPTRILCLVIKHTSPGLRIHLMLRAITVNPLQAVNTGNNCNWSPAL